MPAILGVSMQLVGDHVHVTWDTNATTTSALDPTTGSFAGSWEIIGTNTTPTGTWGDENNNWTWTPDSLPTGDQTLRTADIPATQWTNTHYFTVQLDGDYHAWFLDGAACVAPAVLDGTLHACGSLVPPPVPPPTPPVPGSILLTTNLISNVSLGVGMVIMTVLLCCALCALGIMIGPDGGK